MKPRIRMPADGSSQGDVIVLDRSAARRLSDPDCAPTRVLVAHGEGLVRAGLRALLEAEPDITVSEQTAHGPEALELAIQELPDVVLVDLRLPGLDALEVTRRIAADPALSRVKVLMLGKCETDDDLFGALRAGVSGFLVNEAEPGDLLRAVRAVAAGDALLSPSVTRRVIEELASAPDPHRPVPEQLDELTAREREVMSLVAIGLSNHEIADRLVVSPATVKTHVSRTMLKLGVHDRAKLVALAYQTGLVQPRLHREDDVLRGRAARSAACALAAA